MSDLITGIHENCRQAPVQLTRQAQHELHFVLRDSADLPRVAAWAAGADCDAISFFASDERALEAGTFKLYLVLSAPEGQQVILEQALTTPGRPAEFLAIHQAFPNAARWEQEIAELFGLLPRDLPLPTAEPTVLAGPYPPNFHPLLRSASMAELLAALPPIPLSEAPRPAGLPEGVLSLSAGPIHAGIKEAGALRIQAAGETVEALQLDPGRKHRGLEKLFEARRLVEGWRLAEVIDGEAPFAHSLAYCQAVESIAGFAAPPLAESWRAALLELERIASHIGNIALLVHDMALPVAAAPMSKLREDVRRLNAQLTGSRFLRGVNRPGGINLAPGLTGRQLAAQVDRITTSFLALSLAVAESPACRDRLIGTGVLSAEEARRCGASGVIRRACGAARHDYRLRHPFGAYKHPKVRAEILATCVDTDADPAARTPSPPRAVTLKPTDLAGDNFARLMFRIAEVETSARIIGCLAAELVAPPPAQPLHTPLDAALGAVDPFELGLGCVEGGRGAIIHCGISGPSGRPLRWKFADPSAAALCALDLAASYRSVGEQRKISYGDIIADIPLDNVSMNASLAACVG